MRIAVMGAGGVGGYFGGLLARAGNEVTLIARGVHLEAIRAHGLHVISQWGDFSVAVDATDEPSRVGPVELVVLSVNPNPPKDTDGRREDSGRGWVRELQGRWPGVLG